MGIIYIMVAIMAAWILQTLLGSGQINDFNRNYNELRQKGRVSIGRSKGIVRTGVVLLMRIDKRHRIRDARKMQGVTILAKFKEFDLLKDQDLLNISPEVYEKMDRFTKKAFDDAVVVYKQVAKGEEVPERKSPFKKLISGFSK